MPLLQQFKRLSFVFSFIVALVGLLVLIGWAGNITVLKSISPDWISMKANAAICFLLAGTTLILVNRGKKNGITKGIITFFSFIIFIIGSVTVFEYIFKFNAGIDEFIFKDNTNSFPAVSSGRQSPFSAAYFMLFGFCYLPWIYKRIGVSLFQLLHIISGIFVLAAALSYLLGSYIIAGNSLDFIFVIHSTIAFLFLIMAVLFSQPEKGYMKMVSSNTTGGRIIRKYLPLFLFIFVAIGWLGLRGEQAGFFNTTFSVSLLIILMIIIFGFILFSGAASLADSEVIQKQSEEKLLHSNKTLEAAEKMAKLGSWEYNMNGQEGIWSKQIFRLLNLPITGKAPSFKEFLLLIHPDEREPAQEIFDRMVDGIEIENKIFRTNPENGDIKYLLLDWHVVKDAVGKPIKYFGTLQCVTERIKTMQTLKQSEELFKKAFHSRVFGLAIVNKERRVVDINETLTSLLGYSREDFIGKTSAEIGLVDPEYIKKRDELLVLLFTTGRIDDYELDIITRHGKSISLLLSVEPLTLNETPHWLIYLKDITEKRKAEKQLAESEIRLRTILDTVPECVKIIDDKGELTYMNPAGLAIVEADDFEMVKGRKGLTNINEPYLKEFYQLVTKVFSGISAKMEYEITGFKGTHRWVETHIVPLTKSKYSITSILCVTRDITEKKIIENEIIISEEKYRTLVEQADDAIFIIDQEFRLVTINQSGYKLTGYNQEELMNMTINDFVFEEDLKRDPFHFNELAKGKTVRNERRMKRKGGIPIDVEIIAKLITNGDILVFCRDISERKKAGQLLTDSEERLSRAEKIGNLGHGFYDMLSGTMHLSAGLYKIFGVKPDEFSHTSEGLKSVIHPGDYLIQEKAIDKMFNEGKVEVEFRIIRPDGEVRNVLFKTELTKNTEGGFLNSFTTALDITESRKAEEQIKYYNLQLKQLAANLQNIREEERRRIGREIHDELGQRLTVLKMGISGLKKIYRDEKNLKESIEEMLMQVEECIKSSRRISTDLRPSIIDDLGLIAALKWQAEEFGKRTSIRSVFKTDLSDIELPLDFTIGVFRIFQESLTNIARHADATQVTSTLFMYKGELVLSITDNGKGFDTETVDTKGTLGLIGIKERTLLMKGSYDITSSPGKGTQIMVIIPVPFV